MRKVVYGAKPGLSFGQGSFLECHQCSQCTGVCPSMRNGGINPRDIMMRYAIGTSDPKDPILWLCMMCQSCTERCQLDVGPADLIKDLRSLGAGTGNCPRAFSEEAKLFMRTGLSFPNTGLTKKVRKELGLPDIQSDERTLNDLQLITRRSRLGALKFD